MALIRDALATEMARDAVVLDLGDLAGQGRKLLEEARARADEIIREAQQERQRLTEGAADEGRQQGYEAGHAAGLEEGKAQGHAEALEERKQLLETLDQQWGNALGAFVASQEKIRSESTEAVLTLALAIGERITRRAIDIDPEVAARQVEACLDAMNNGAQLEVRVNPDDLDAVRESLPRTTAAAQSDHIQLIPDETIERGGCICQRDHAGLIDATVATQIERVAQAVGVERADVAPQPEQPAAAPGDDVEPEPTTDPDRAPETEPDA